MKLKIKRGDDVVVIAGSHKNARGKVLEVDRGKARILVDRVNLVKRHQRRTEENPNGAIVEREAPLAYSNVMLASRFDAKKARTK